MYVVRRPFKNYGATLVAGTIIDDPATIKLFKNKLSDGKIVEVTEENKASYAEYFQLKFGVDILHDNVAAEEPTVKEATEVPTKSAEKKVVKVVSASVVK